MPRPYRIIPLVERTHAWWEWRQSGVGSADAVTILDEKRAKSVERLLFEKQQPAKDSARRFEQARSAVRERQARTQYCRTIGIEVPPTCVQSVARPWQRASLDGLSADGERAVEIKCGKATYATAAARQRPAREHYPQLQHILAVLELPVVDYWCYCPPHPPLRLEVQRDPAYIERLLAAEEVFWRRLKRDVVNGGPAAPTGESDGLG
jgi:putative phage-type endonuclease